MVKLPGEGSFDIKMYLSNSELEQLNLLKKRTPVERFIIMAQLIAGQVEAMKAGIKYRNPHITKEELGQCLRQRMMEIYSLRR